MERPIDIAFFQNLLLERRAALLAGRESRSEDSRPVELDQTRVGRLSRMDALQQAAMAKALTQKAEAELRRIDAALERIEDEEYGYCAVCEEEIGPGRLKFDPTIEICVSCAEAAENRRR